MSSPLFLCYVMDQKLGEFWNQARVPCYANGRLVKFKEEGWKAWVADHLFRCVNIDHITAMVFKTQIQDTLPVVFLNPKFGVKQLVDATKRRDDSNLNIPPRIGPCCFRHAFNWLGIIKAKGCNLGRNCRFPHRDVIRSDKAALVEHLRITKTSKADMTVFTLAWSNKFP